jgi:ABC-type branched-subunit amino acid transport system ATPase component
VADRIYDVIAELAVQVQAVVVVEQNSDRAMAAPQCVDVMDRGRIALEGSSSSLSGNDRIAHVLMGLSAPDANEVSGR